MLRSLMLSLTLVVFAIGSVSMAVARHHPRAAYDAELCTGYGAVTVSIGEDGQPVKSRPLCPDCVPAMVAIEGVAVTAEPRESRLVAVAFVPARTPALLTSQRDAHRSRAPPVLI